MTVKTLGRRRGRVAPYELRPDRLSPGPYAWFDASQIVGLSDGDPVSTWADESGNARDLAQTGSPRPLYKTNRLNGLPSVLFAAASSQYMQNDALAAMFTGSDTAFTAFIVAKLTNTTGEQGYYGVARSTAANPTVLFYANSTWHSYRRNDSGTVKHVATGASLDTSAHILRKWFDGTTGRRFKDGVQIGTDFAESDGAVTLDRFMVGVEPSNTGATAGTYLSADVFELVLVPRAMTSLELVEVERYLGRKYAIAVP